MNNSSDLKPLSGFTNSLNSPKTSFSSPSSLNSISESSIDVTPSSIFSSMWFWLILILVLAFVGFNVFSYLAKGTDLLVQITSFFTYIFATISKFIVNIGATGTQAVVDVSASAIDTSLEVVKENTDGKPNEPTEQQQQGQQQQEQGQQQQEQGQQQQQQGQQQLYMQQQQPYPTSYPQSNEFPPSQTEMEPMPASAMDSDNKSGWCLVGQEQGFRSCIEVGDFDKCMSGSIFPSKDICTNPNLRV
jgi:hypothetical protein